ncbi:class I adenylate-forming enzyme family protein [Actinophytocola algeriensis]|uniref:Acyl-CoA synthetase (AMP-forming)/AMP-acid ligase II n=1 Tax=Actinophytocola algeriensis TaxID=1768010 RepID=A0A7W7Q9P0_9PSEU|nr:class I adenylate-forming enzyme family protein [Actinophytocola algeriensis]MBB4909453.1 acyl-CoA synthetase (AMP-forming)/AMP-acid ligase II [Actinophytocola algeriensis]MBE1475443.1 acyl-CoA synthetase (AMP-forming)/AMP-acid ligase II [Actinophytocola algeriensis]
MLRTDLIRPLTELLRQHAAATPNKVAFVDPWRSVTWADLELRSARVAGHLADMGLQPADRVLLYLDNMVEAVESHLAVLRAGAISAPIHIGLGDAELATLLAESRATTIFTDIAHAHQVNRVRRGFPNLTVVLVDHEGEDLDDDLPLFPLFSELAEVESEAPADGDLGLDDLSFLTYTAGVTGAPRAVLFSQRNVMWAIAACYAPILGLGPEDRVACPLPLAHGITQQVAVIGVLATGATGLLTPTAAEDVADLMANRTTFLADLARQRITFVAGLPSTYQDMLWAASYVDVELPELRVALVAGASSVNALRTRFEERFGHPLLDSYMTTETTGPVAVSGPADDGCGLPIPGVSVRVIDPRTGKDAGVGQEGELWVSGPNVTAGGYHLQAAEISDGWFHTGDLATRDAHGSLTITGRMAELITRGATPVNPREIEHVLRGVDGVAAAVVVGELDEALGEVPVAYLQTGPDGVDPAAVFTACRALSPAKVPVKLYRVPELPRVRAGKPARLALRDLAAELLAVQPVERGTRSRNPLTDPAD